MTMLADGDGVVEGVERKYSYSHGDGYGYGDVYGDYPIYKEADLGGGSTMGDGIGYGYGYQLGDGCGMGYEAQYDYIHEQFYTTRACIDGDPLSIACQQLMMGI